MKLIRRTLVLAVSLGFASLAVPGTFAMETPSRGDSVNRAEAPVNWTQVEVRSTSAPQLFRGSDHRYNLVYELLVTNFGGGPMTVNQIDVIDASSGKIVLTLDEKTLPGVFTQVNKTAGTKLAAGQSALVWVNLSFEDPEQAPKQLLHRVAWAGNDFEGKPKSFTNTGSKTSAFFRAPVVISPPLRGGRWCAFGGYSGVAGHRRALFPINNALYSAQRYAIDWARLDSGNYTTKGDPSKVTSSPSYGLPVYAVSDATVYGVVDRFQDQIPLKPVGEDRYYYPGGNSITLDIGNGLYAFYAHLKPGSIKVKPGDMVKRGEIIAQIGNSGNSSGPHLHFHVTDAPDVLGSNGVPYLFDQFNLVGDLGDANQIMKVIKDDEQAKPHTILKTPLAGKHEEELVKEGHVVDFGD